MPVTAKSKTMKSNRGVDGFIRKSRKWPEELKALRSIILSCPLTEEVKWRVPCYTLEGKNVVLMNGFKEFVALSFVKGALLKDPKGILQKIGQAQAGRWVKLTSVEQISEMKSVLKAYILEAIEVEKSGEKVKMKKTSDFPIPDEFKEMLDRNAALKKAFEALTPGRQRGYLYYFSGAKQSKTRTERVEKYMPQILKGKGFDD
jgi:uncharacterized protein YdeI (YjbR/CyaY-like superfamily)